MFRFRFLQQNATSLLGLPLVGIYKKDGFGTKQINCSGFNCSSPVIHAQCNHFSSTNVDLKAGSKKGSSGGGKKRKIPKQEKTRVPISKSRLSYMYPDSDSKAGEGQRSGSASVANGSNNNNNEGASSTPTGGKANLHITTADSGASASTAVPRGNKPITNTTISTPAEKLATASVQPVAKEGVEEHDEAGDREAQEQSRIDPSVTEELDEAGEGAPTNTTLESEVEEIDDDESGLVDHEMEINDDADQSTTNLSGNSGKNEGSVPTGAQSSASSAASTGGTLGTVGLSISGPGPEIGSLLDFESAINLRLATLTQQGGRAFRTIAVRFPLSRGSMNFEVTFEDLGSGAQLVCNLDEVKTSYMEWVNQFRASFIALFLPTLQHANATILVNAILSARPGRPPPPAGSYHPRLNEDADHLFFSYSKLREIISKKKKDTEVDSRLLMVTVLNAYPDEWKNFINTPGACAPQAFLQAAYNFRKNTGLSLNSELLHAQLSTAADCMSLFQHKKGTVTAGSEKGKRGNKTAAASFKKGKGGNIGHLTSGTLAKASDQWRLIFVPAPVNTVNANVPSVLPLLQDLCTGQFVDPLTLSNDNVVYIIGTGAAAESFARIPLARKGRNAYSILLEDIESQLGVQRSHRVSLTSALIQALDNFSRLTWMGLMKEEEEGQVRVPHPPNAFYKLQHRTVQREIVPSYIESVFSPLSKVSGGVAGAAASPSPSVTAGKSSRRLEEHIASIFINIERADREKALKDELTKCKALFISINTADVTAARRADNPFSEKNGLTSVQTQFWNSLTLPNPPEIKTFSADEDEMGNFKNFISPDDLFPADFPLEPSTSSNAKARACNGIIVAWDAKRVVLFLRQSKKLRKFLLNGGRIWCTQYAQYILKGFNHHHLGTMERTLLQFHAGPLRAPMHPLAKLKFIYETQLSVGVLTRQLISMEKRMDGLLASAEMEYNGLQLAPQKVIDTFAESLRRDHERLEKELQEKVSDFTKVMDDDVRQRINFRSPQDISTIIYGGALCRHLGSRFVPVRSTKYPVTSLFPHAICKVTGCAVPEVYSNAQLFVQSEMESSGSANNRIAAPFDVPAVNNSLKYIIELCKKSQMANLETATAVVVVIVKSKIGGLIEQFSLFCPSIISDEPEINVRVAIDDILPVMDNPDLVTITQLKELISNYKPLRQLHPLKKHGRKSFDLRNVLIVTTCSHERLEPLVDTGIITTIEETILGKRPEGEPSPFERVCFADLQKAFPPPPQSEDSFEADFNELTGATQISFSAKANWDAHTSELQSMGGYEGVVKALFSHCASVIGSPRDAFRNSHPVPSALPRGIHGQEQASTAGMLWMVTPPSLHPVLRKFLAGRAASSSADAMERVTVLLSPYKDVNLSFFSALQQLRFTEKKLQLFDEGCLFRAVLPENRDRVHGELCHCVTATGRLSSQAPNLQNIPKEQDLRRLIVSRFGSNGVMIEADYSQLEVVVLAALSRDPKMLKELKDKVDFHCMRVSLMRKEPYDEVVRKTKVDKNPEYIQLRQQAKVFSFQRQYGAGIATIATTTGLTEQEVEKLIAAEEQHYKELGRYYRLVMDCVEGGADRILRMRNLDLWEPSLRRVVMLTEPLNYFVVGTGSKFDFTKDKKSIPRLKNYPVQGLAGEIVQIMCGRIVRSFLEKKNYNEKAFLVNTVHDCVWVDAHKDVADEVSADLDKLMSSTESVMSALFPEMAMNVSFGVEVKKGPSLGEFE